MIINETTVSLTEEQALEFDTPLLQIFAKSFIVFQNSSPCTAKRKLYRYFEPLKDDQLSNDSILYGPDREKSYNELLSNFKACKMANEFDKFFIDKKHHWQSESIPRLIILKEWLS